MGAAPRSLLSRLPSLRRKLGPIKGVSYSTGRKLALTLRSGFAVPNYGALAACPVIWVMVPDDSLEQVLRGLAEQPPLPKSILVICGSSRESRDFPFLKGQRVATLNLIDDTSTSGFVAEGHRDALHVIRALLKQEQRRLLEIRAGSKSAYLASVQLMTLLIRALVTSAIQCLQVTGIARPDAVDLVSALATRSAKSQGRVGAKSWSSAERQELRHALELRVHELRELCPLESEVYASAVVLALEYFERLGAPRKVRSHHA